MEPTLERGIWGETISEGVARRADQAGDKNVARIYRLSPQQMRSALSYLSGLDTDAFDKALEWAEAVND